MPNPRADDQRGAEPQTAQPSKTETSAAATAGTPPAGTAHEPAGPLDVVRRAFVARVVARSSAPAGPSAAVKKPAANTALRSAYLAHLTEGKAEGAGDWEPHGGETLRHAYLVHAAAHSNPQISGSGKGASHPIRRRKQPRR